MRKILFVLFFIFFLSLNFFNETFATESVVELKNNIKNLEKEHKELVKKKHIIYNNGKLYSFLKDNLNNKQKKYTNYLILEINKALLNENQGLEEIKSLKPKLYKDLGNYVDEDKKNEYLSFIEKDVNISVDSFNVKKKIDVKNEVLNDKMSKIKEKIIENRQENKNDIEKMINYKIDKKLEIIKNNENFLKFDFERKKYIINKLIENIREKRSKSVVLLGEDIDLYDIVIKRLEEYIKTLENK